MDQKIDKIREILRELAAAYFSRESNRQSLITITNVEVMSRGGRATIMITVLPESMEATALEFARRQLAPLREYIQANSRIARVPFFDVKIDVGEKNRQRIDTIAGTKN